MGAAIVIASGVQGGHALAPAYETLLVALAITAMALACALISISLRRRHRRPKPVADEWQALTVMGELCPHGWQAQVTLHGWDSPAPAGAPSSRVPLVGCEWKLFENGSETAVVTRRVWAPTIGEALQSMVDDRRTDIALEQIGRLSGRL